MDDGYRKITKVDIQHYPYFKLDDKGTWPEIVDVIRDIKPGIITLDHLLCFHDQDENSSRGMERVARGMLNLVDVSGSTVFVSHHFGKKVSGTFYQRLRGSGVIYARSEAAFEVRALSHKGGKLESFGLIPQPRKEKLCSPIRVVLEEDDECIRLKHNGDYQPVDDPVLDRIAHMIAHIFLKEPEERTVEEVKLILAGMSSDPETREALRTLEKKGVVKTKRSGSSHKYVYTLDAAVCPWCGLASKP